MTPLIVSSIALASVMSLFGSGWALFGYCIGIVAAALDRRWIDRLLGLDWSRRLAIVGFLALWWVTARNAAGDWAALPFVGVGAMLLGLSPMKQQAWAIGLLIAGSLLAAGLTIIQGFGPDRGLLVPNDLLFLACLLPLGCSSVGGKWRPTILVALLGFLGLSLAILSRSRLLFLTTCLSVGLLLWIVRIGRADGAKVMVTLAAAAAVLISIEPGSLAKLSAPVLDRWRLWRVAWDGFLAQPWLGHGWNAFASFLDNHPLQQQMIDQRSIPWPHSLWLESLFAGGLALFLALLFVVGCAARGFRLRHDPFLSTSLIAFIIAATFEASWLRWWTWWMFFYLIGRLVPTDWRHG